MEEEFTENPEDVTTADPDEGRKLSETTKTAVLNVLYNNLQKTIIECIAKGVSLLISVSDETPKLQTLPGRAVVSVPGDIQIVNLSKDIRSLLMNEDVFLKGDESAENDDDGVEFRKEDSVEFRKEIVADLSVETPNEGVWNCACMYCKASFSRKCPLFKARQNVKSPKVKKATCTRRKKPPRKQVNIQRRTRVTCQYCGKVITNQSLKFHMENHQGKRYQCRHCPKTFQTPFSRTRHEKIHTQGHYKTITCPHCPKSFYSNGAFNVHLNSKHRKVERYFCDICGKGFYFKNQLTMHHRVHTREQPYACPHCTKDFRTMNQMTQHVKAMHTGLESTGRKRSKKAREDT